jgi:prepilin-type N-terminal cleavage/methylation domain-containing protein
MARARFKGFSLIELLVVLVLLGLLTALVVPRFFNTLGRLEARSTSKKISAILRYCRSESVNKNRIYLASFDSNSNALSILYASVGDEKPTSERAYTLPREMRVEKVDAGRTLLDVSLPSFEFYPNGGSNGGTALVTGGERREYLIQVDFLTGSVKVEETK